MSGFVARRHVLLASAVLALLPLSAAANSPQSGVIGSWRGAPASVAVGTEIDLVLHLEAAADAPLATVELLPSAGIEFLTPRTTWGGSLLRGRIVDLPVTVRVVQDGDWTVGARITNYRPQGNQVAGAVLHVVAVNGTATLGRETHDEIKLAAISTPEEARALGIAAIDNTVVVLDRVVGPAIATTVTGTITWRDPEGNQHPVRRAHVQLANGAGTILTTTASNDAGGYSAAINTDSVKVTVFTQDFENIRVNVFPEGQPGQRYVLESPLTPITAAATIVNVASAATARGTPGAPSNDSTAARAFAVYDSMLTFWFHASALIGRNMQKALTNFPQMTCSTSCYQDSNQQMYINRGDAFDWDVAGHEFFHFTVDRGRLRVIDTSLGGDHSGGTAIGQNDGTGHLRTRDEGMRLAWSEGLATVMSLLIQKTPPAPFAFPALLHVGGDGFYTETENQQFADNAETMPLSEGFGSENSVVGLLWDLSDTAQDSVGLVTDNFAGLNASLLWAAINALLPSCNPCDRVDKFWTGIVNLFGVTSPTLLQVGKIFALNNIAARTISPADGESVAGTAAPTFIWFENGDPGAAHRNNQFFLVFSRDNFVSHRAVIPVPGLDDDRYTPTDAEWASVQGGGRGGETYKWFVAAKRSDDPSIPQGWFWYSNVLSIAPRSLEATITWSPVGADVDLHLANPSGTDIAYYNRTTSWGFLDRDCITTCAQEIISVTSLPLRGPYRLFTHYYSDHGRGPATVHAVVRSGSQVLLDQTFVLSTSGATHTLVSFALDGTQATATDAGGDTVLAPALLPAKRSP